jgi:hypothetical protein
MEERKEHLQRLLSELSNSLEINGKRYFHIRTVENLIFHFEEIKTENDRTWVYEVLVEYFHKCSQLVPSIDRSLSKDLFNEYIDKITDYYHSNLGFVMLINRSIVYLFYLIILILCFIYFNIYVLLVVLSLCLLQIIKAYKKYKERKVYGLFW